MAVRFVLNDKFVAEVDEDLMREYRKMMEIPEEKGDPAVLQDIINTQESRTDCNLFAFCM